jgi:hypothetical protein
MLVDYLTSPREGACYYLQCLTLFEVLLIPSSQSHVIAFGMLMLFTSLLEMGELAQLNNNNNNKLIYIAPLLKLIVSGALQGLKY